MIIFIEIDKDTTASSWTSYIMASALWYQMTQSKQSTAKILTWSFCFPAPNKFETGMVKNIQTEDRKTTRLVGQDEKL